MNVVRMILDILTPRRAALLIAAAAIGTIAGAQFFEHVLGILPCELCLKQRVPYYVAVPIALVTACLPNRSVTIRLGLAFLALIFIASAGLAAYHAGVEWKFWPGPTDCSSGGAAGPASVNDLLAQMQNVKVESCSEASWRLFGLSLAGWNVLISLGLVGTAFLALSKAVRR